MFDFRPSFQNGIPFEGFLSKYGDESDLARWSQRLRQVRLTAEQTALLKRFRRRMKILCMAGAWCGDCAAQCPIVEAIARACPFIELRFVDRDADAGLAGELQLCGSPRIPQLVFLDEDGNHVGRFGDRPLSTYRQLAEQLGEALDVPPHKNGIDLLVQDWLNEIERIQWLLRTSPRLRQRYGD